MHPDLLHRVLKGFHNSLNTALPCQPHTKGDREIPVARNSSDWEPPKLAVQGLSRWLLGVLAFEDLHTFVIAAVNVVFP